MRILLLTFLLSNFFALSSQSISNKIPSTKISSESITALSYDGRTSLWLKYNSSLYQFSGRAFSIFEKKNMDSAQLIFLGRKEHLIYFRSDQNLYLFDKLKDSLHTFNLPNKEIIQFATLQKNRILCQQNGIIFIYELENQTFKPFSEFVFPKINSAIFTRNQEIWLATAGGLRVIKNGELQSNQNVLELFQKPINYLIQDDFDNIWIFPDDHQLLKFNGNRLISVENIPKMSFSGITDAIYVDYKLWIINPEDGLASYNLNNGRWTHYFKLDSIPFLGYTEICSDNYNHLWLAGDSGLLRIDLLATPEKPSLYIDDVKVLFNSLISNSTARQRINTSGNDYTLDPDENYLSFSFSGGNLGNEAVQFQYFLDGYNESWSPWNYETQVTYSDLPPGKYKFHVRASANGQIAEISSGLFKIKSPVWTKERIKAFLLSSIILILLLSVYLFYRNQRNRMQRLKIDLELREASITWQQKALQLQMNPHFIFNVLNSIKGLIAEQNSKAARNQIQNFSNFLRGMLDHSRSESISLREEIKFLKQYLQLEQSMQSQAFEYIFEVEESLLEPNPNIPPMMTQVFIENAIKHGFKNIEHPGILSLKADLFGQNVRFSIQDNGQGRANALASEKTHTSHAIQVIRDRLKSLAPDTKIERVKIVDLSDENGIAIGTLVILILPILKEK